MGEKIADITYLMIQTWCDGIVVFGIILAIIIVFTSMLFKDDILKKTEEKDKEKET